nr:unnamed protein product [Callosobruchus chinensis]
MVCGEAIVKLIVFSVNTVFSLAGLGILATGILYKLHFNNVTNAIPADYQDIQIAPTLAIVIGSIIFTIAFLGCFGTVRESTCLLNWYAIILLVIFLSQIAIGVFAFLEIRSESSFKSAVKGTLLQAFNGYEKESNKEIVNLLQEKFKCCGVEGPDYWLDKPTGIPSSCFNEQTKRTDLHTDGCLNKFVDFLHNSVRTIGIVVLTLSATEVAGAALLGVGVLLKIKNNDIQNFIPDKYYLGLPPLLLIIIGSVIFISATFGCCGAVKENTCMLTTFAIILLTLLIIQVAIGVYAFLMVGDTQDLKTSVKQLVEKTFNDYNNTKIAKGKVPDSCCAGKQNCSLMSNDCYRQGCAASAYRWFKNGLDLLGILAIAIAVIEIVGAIFALCLSSSIKNQIRREAYA